MVDISKLNVVVGADISGAEAGLEKIGGAVGGFAKTAALALAGAAVGIAGAGAAAVKSAADFESTMSGVKAVSGATNAEMKGLSGLALQLGKDTAYSASEAAAGIEELVKGGLSIEDIMGGAAKSTLNLAAAGGVSLPDAATIAANALAQFSLKGKDMAHVADLIAGAANASALDVGQFKFSLQSAGAVAATVGFSFDDLATAIAVMGKAGITGSDAGTSLKTMFLSLQPTTDKQKSLFKELGLTLKDGSNAFFDATGKVKSMADVSQTLQNALGKMTKAQQLSTLELIFGTDAIRAGAVFTKAGAAGFNEMSGAMAKVTAESVGLEKLNNFNGDIKTLGGSVETLAITFGTALLPILRQGTQYVTEFVNSMIPWVENIGPQVVAWTDKITAAFASGGLSGALKTVGADALQFGGVILSWIGDLLPKLLTEVSNWGSALASWIIPMIPSVLSKLGEFGLALFNWIKDTGVPNLLAAATLLGNVLIDWIKPVVLALPGALLSVGTAIWSWITDTALPVVISRLISWGSAFIDWIKPVVLALPGALLSVGTALYGWITDTALPFIVAKLVTWGSAFIDWVLPLLQKLPAAIGSIKDTVILWIGNHYQPILDKLGTWKDAFVDWVLPVIKLIPGKIGDIKDAVVKWIGTNWRPIVDKIGTWKDAFIDWVAPVVDAIPGKVGEVKDAIVKWIGENWQPIVDKIGTWKDAFIDWVSVAIQAIPTKLAGFKNTLVTWITETALPAIKTAWAGFDAIVWPAIVGAMQRARDGLKPVWAEITTSMSDFEPTGLRIERLFNTIGTTLDTVVKPAFEWVGKWLWNGSDKGENGGFLKAFAAGINAQTAVWERWIDRMGKAIQTLKDIWDWLDKVEKKMGIDIRLPEPNNNPSGAVGGATGGGGITTVPIGAGQASPRTGQIVIGGPDVNGKYLYSSNGGRNVEWRDQGGPGYPGQQYAIGVPEIFKPDTPGRFIPLGGAASMQSGPITIPIYIGGEKLTTVVAQGNKRWEDRGGR